MTASAGVHERAEILRLARLLNKRPEELQFLLAVDDADLRAFRAQVTESLFNAHGDALRRLGSAAKLLPSAIIAKVGEKVFGPLLCARIAGELEPSKATDIAKRLSVSFLADVAVELDPRRAQRIIEALPTDTIVATSVELANRGDWITLGAFVGYLPMDKLRQCLDALSDEHILRTAFAVDDEDAIPAVIDALSKERVISLLRTASDTGSWPTLLDITSQLRDDQVAQVAGYFDELDEPVLVGLPAAVAEHQLWSRFLPIAAELPEKSQQALADAVGGIDADARSECVRAAEHAGVFDRLGPLADALREAVR